MPGSPGDSLSGLSQNASSLVLVAPYIKVDALSRVLPNIKLDASLICITRWKAQDILTGTSDVECRTIVKERGGAFRIHPSLHAKYYRVDGAVLVGSANLTSAAMGWGEKSNLEILCAPGPDFDAIAFEQHLLENSREVSDSDFEYWQALANLDLEGGSAAFAQDARVRTWRPATRDPRNLIMAYRDEINNIASLDEQQAARRDINALNLPLGLTSAQVRDWALAYLLAAPFTDSVIQNRNIDSVTVARSLSSAYGIDVTEARRDLETVQNWLTFLMPDIKVGNSSNPLC